MSRAIALALLGTAALLAVGLLVWTTLPGETVLREAPAGPRAFALNSTFVGTGDDHGHGMLGCEVCHYGWKDPVETLALREDLPGGRSDYTVQTRPIAAYNVTALLVAPVGADGAAPNTSSTSSTVRVDAPGGSRVIPYTFQGPASALLVDVRPQDGYKRPEVRLDVDGTPGTGARSFKSVLLTAPDGGSLEGPVSVRVSLPDPVDATLPLVVTFQEFGAGYRVASEGTRGEPAEVRFAGLPSPGASGAPTGFATALLLFNDHPTDRWRLDAQYDRALYTGNVSAAGGVAYALGVEDEALPPPFPSIEECDRAFGGKESKLLYQESFDGMRTSYRNARGEWTRAGIPIRADIPPEAPFPGLPPCTVHVKATLVWQKRAPLAPDPLWIFSYSQRPSPVFHYPEPTSLGPGERVDIVPMTPADWETTETGWFQAFYLLGVDREGKAAFDGSYTYRLEALRTAPPT